MRTITTPPNDIIKFLLSFLSPVGRVGDVTLKLGLLMSSTLFPTKDKTWFLGTVLWNEKR
jgi:hypothetical protein